MLARIWIALTLFCAVGAHASAMDPPNFIYEIFTHSFGSLEGVRSRLNYVSSLGADAIWLSPIFNSPSEHGYDVTDYESIQSNYGSMSQFKNLIANAHSRGIRVLLDMPVNHTSIHHPWFSDKSLYLWSPEPKYLPKQWCAKEGEFYFSSFSCSMADLNWTNPEVLSRVEQVFDFWTNLGVDGFRLDAAKFLIKGPNGEQNMPETHSIWKQIVDHVRQSAPRAYFVGEVWDSANAIANYYGHGDELDAAFNFPVAGALRASLHAKNNSSLVSALRMQLASQKNPFFAAPFAGNHDLDRLATALGSDLALEKLAALIVFTLPGTPVVYYGDEIGMKQGNVSQFPGDRAKRIPMDWNAVTNQDSVPGSLLNTYRELAKVRQASAALRLGPLLQMNAIEKGAISYLRQDGNATVLVVLNFSDHALPDGQLISVAGKKLNRAGPIPQLYGTARAQWKSQQQIAIDQLGPKQGAIFQLSL